MYIVWAINTRPEPRETINGPQLASGQIRVSASHRRTGNVRVRGRSGLGKEVKQGCSFTVYRPCGHCYHLIMIVGHYTEIVGTIAVRAFCGGSSQAIRLRKPIFRCCPSAGDFGWNLLCWQWKEAVCRDRFLPMTEPAFVRLLVGAWWGNLDCST